MASAATNGTTTNTKPVSRLAKVQKGRLRTPTTVVVYGPEGVGKTTLAASAPGVIFMDIEDGSSELEVARYPFRDDPKTGHIPLTYAEVLAGIEDLTTSDHGYKALAIDSIDRLESLIWKHMLARDSVPSARNPKATALESIEDYGFGKGYNSAVEEWRALCVKLDRLRYAKQMEIILIGHALVKTFKNPAGDDYDRYQLRVNDKAAGFLKEWAKVTAFACFEDDAAKTPGSKTARPKGFSTGRRLLKLGHTAAVDAKTRLALPDEVEIDIENPWAPFAAAVTSAYDAAVPKLGEEIAAELARINDPDLGAKAKGPIDAAVEAKDIAALSRYLNDLRKRPAKVIETA